LEAVDEQVGTHDGRVEQERAQRERALRRQLEVPSAEKKQRCRPGYESTRDEPSRALVTGRVRVAERDLEDGKRDCADTQPRHRALGLPEAAENLHARFSIRLRAHAACSPRNGSSSNRSTISTCS